MSENINETIWAFIRGDMQTIEFENWLYGQSSLENIFGQEFYLELISNDFKSNEQVYQIKFKLEEKIKDVFPLLCKCLSIADADISNMGNEQDSLIFSTLKEVKRYGDPLWWLSLDQCSNCQQYWLIAQEESQNDIFCFKRLTVTEANNILINNCWPTYFQTYEELLQLGKNHGIVVTFLNPESISLNSTIMTLAIQRPGISVNEIAALLNLTKDTAYIICQKAVEKENLIIDLA